MNTNALKPTEAISSADLYSWGCPACGYRSGNTPISCGPVAQWRCGECNKNSTVVMGELKVGETVKNTFRAVDPKFLIDMLTVVAHPREGTPARGRPDAKPIDGGEFFTIRGIGTDITPGCFVCGGERGYHTNISGFVAHVDAGDRVVRLVGRGAWLDYRPSEPDRIQVKIGACNLHDSHLKHLAHSVRNGVLTWKMVTEAREHLKD